MTNWLALPMAATLAACSPQTVAGALDTVASAPAPAERTTIDEKAVTLAAQTVDALALTASALVQARVIVPGSPLALRLAKALDVARDGVNAAELARQAGSAGSYAVALDRALAAVAEIKAIVAEVKG